MDTKVLIDRKTLKAITSDSRYNILKLLGKRKYTLSEITNKLNLSNSTVKEHLDILNNAGLIEKIDDSRKWKYYKLTNKGKKLVEPREIKVILTFIITTLAVVGILGRLFIGTFNLGSNHFSEKAVSRTLEYGSDLAVKSVANTQESFAMDAAVDGAGSCAVNVPQTIETVSNCIINNQNIWWFVLLLVLILITGILIGYFIKKRKNILLVNEIE